MVECAEAQTKYNNAKDEEDHLMKNGAVDNVQKKGLVTFENYKTGVIISRVAIQSHRGFNSQPGSFSSSNPWLCSLLFLLATINR